MFQYKPEAQWTMSRQNIASRVRSHFQIPKFLFTIVWGTAGFQVTNLMIPQPNFKSEYFVNETIRSLIDKLFPGGRMPHASRVIEHLDNCRVHFSKHTQMFFDENFLLRVPQPPYSPDLGPSDFWLFGDMKVRCKDLNSKGQTRLFKESMTF
jgi:hypothetical protein